LSAKRSRGAEATHNAGLLDRFAAELGGDGNGVIAADDRAEIAAGRQLVMQTAISDQIDLTMADLAIDDTGQINPASPTR
jgi:hypothetical protein